MDQSVHEHGNCVMCNPWLTLCRSARGNWELDSQNRQSACGVQGKASTAVHCSDGVSAAETFQIEENHSKAHALGNALACSMVIPWALCAVLYTGA